MQLLRLLPFLTLCISLYSCRGDNKPMVPTFGELDSSKVALDTTMQVNIDRSYEYQRSLVVNDSKVYEFLAYDKPKGVSTTEWESKFILIEHTRAATQDTLVRDFRSGIVKNVWLSDLDSNSVPELNFYEYPKGSSTSASYYLYELNGNGAKRIALPATAVLDSKYHGLDTFFGYQGYLIRKYPITDSQTQRTGAMWQSYRLSHGALILAKQEGVL